MSKQSLIAAKDRRIKQAEIEKRKHELCLRCLKCCQIAIFELKTKGAVASADEKFFWECRNCEIVSTPLADYVVVHQRCSHLTPFGCSIYADRPNVCKSYDGRRDPVLKNVCLWNELEE